MDPKKLLHTIRSEVQKWGVAVNTKGLSDSFLEPFLTDARLQEAIERAYSEFNRLKVEAKELLLLGEEKLVKELGKGFLNFYPEDQTNPYVPISAAGPWIVTCYGAVIHDNGGYGMLGFGHHPKEVLAAMSQSQVMANVMTASFSQHHFTQRINKELGHTRKNGNPFSKVICINSGSESMSVALRISDIHAKKRKTAEGVPYILNIKGGFHGRTEKPARISDSSRKKYENALYSFREAPHLVTIEPGDIRGLEEAFHTISSKGFFECAVIEPVMGEGNPGLAVTPEFYRVLRERTLEHDAFLIVDSIQAGFRAHGVLSIVDYPGFQDLPAPDMETFSKALNGGQYPFSMVALSESAEKCYVRGVYGNTKTTNPRALDVASQVLDSFNPALRANIVARGQELLAAFKDLQSKYPQAISKVQGTGLLVCMELVPSQFQVVGFGELEEYLRIHGLGVIHGGVNALRLTPHFHLTSQEIKLITSLIEKGLKEGPRKKS